jgi:hypothetical protein
MSTFGRYFRVTTFGESHCRGVGAIVDGVPPRLALDENDIQLQLSRRRPGQSKLTTARNEEDQVSARARALKWSKKEGERERERGRVCYSKTLARSLCSLPLSLCYYAIEREEYMSW